MEPIATTHLRKPPRNRAAHHVFGLDDGVGGSLGESAAAGISLAEASARSWSASRARSVRLSIGWFPDSSREIEGCVTPSLSARSTWERPSVARIERMSVMSVAYTDMYSAVNRDIR